MAASSAPTSGIMNVVVVCGILGVCQLLWPFKPGQFSSFLFRSCRLVERPTSRIFIRHRLRGSRDEEEPRLVLPYFGNVKRGHFFRNFRHAKLEKNSQKPVNFSHFMIGWLKKKKRSSLPLRAQKHVFHSTLLGGWLKKKKSLHFAQSWNHHFSLRNTRRSFTSALICSISLAISSKSDLNFQKRGQYLKKEDKRASSEDTFKKVKKEDKSS